MPNNAEIVLAMWQKTGEFQNTSFWTDPEWTLKFTLYKLMAMCAVSYICELCPALNFPIILLHEISEEFIPNHL